jgi:hypothetical protein
VKRGKDQTGQAYEAHGGRSLWSSRLCTRSGRFTLRGHSRRSNARGQFRRGYAQAADRAYDSDPLDAQLKAEGIEMISPHRKGRKKPKTQDGRKLRRSKRRWRVERLVRLAGEFSAPGGALREARGELPGVRTIGLRDDSTQALLKRSIARFVPTATAEISPHAALYSPLLRVSAMASSKGCPLNPRASASFSTVYL